MRKALADLLEADERVLCEARTHWMWNLRDFGLPNLFSTFLVTNRRVLQQTGILARHTHSLTLSQIEARVVEQTIFGRILGYGDLHLYGSGIIEIRLDNIARPMRVAAVIGKATAARPATGNRQATRKVAAGQAR